MDNRLAVRNGIKELSALVGFEGMLKRCTVARLNNCPTPIIQRNDTKDVYIPKNEQEAELLEIIEVAINHKKPMQALTAIKNIGRQSPFLFSFAKAIRFHYHIYEAHNEECIPSHWINSNGFEPTTPDYRKYELMLFDGTVLKIVSNNANDPHDYRTMFVDKDFRIIWLDDEILAEDGTVQYKNACIQYYREVR